MNPEKVCKSIEDTLREYVRSRSSYKVDADGKVWSSGMSVVSPDDRRIDEMARLVTEAVLRCDDERPRVAVEVKDMMGGDVFTRYSIKEGVAVDEEVTVVKVTTERAGGKHVSRVKYRRPNDHLDEVEIDATYLVAVVRPTKDELRAMLEADGVG